MRDVTTITGREAVSMLMTATPINFSRVPEWYNQVMAPYINYDPTEIKVVIDQGKLISGVLDKKSIGKNSKGGIYHIIAKEHGAEAALNCMYNMQQMAVSHIAQTGYTIGISDLMVSAEIKAEIDQIASDIINKSRMITEELYNGEIIPRLVKLSKNSTKSAKLTRSRYSMILPSLSYVRSIHEQIICLS
jgi:DNA-directed RNA polymerase beta' subunit